MNALEKFRAERKMTQQELAKVLGVSQSLVAHIENGVRIVTAEKAVEWEHLIGIPRAELRPDLFGTVGRAPESANAA